MTTANINEDARPEETPEELPKDDEGLLKEYNVIICGTGLVQSILASALSRAGKTVLHCDSQGHYGELDAVLNFPYLQEGSFWNHHDTYDTTSQSPHELPLYRHSLRLLSTHKITRPPPLQMSTEVTSAYGKGRVTALPQRDDNRNWSSLVVSMKDWKLANGTHAVAYFGIHIDDTVVDKEKALSQLTEKEIVVPTSHIETQHIFQQSRSFALDVSPRLLHASGSAVSGLLASGVADYMEFKSIEGLLWMSKEENKWQLSRVPCSKGDVFGTKLLAPMDKRRLMKFLQLTMDYATAGETNEEESAVPEEEVQSLNERQLNQGRSLARPQNKAVSTQDLEKLEQCIANGMDFETYLSGEQRLSPRLRLLVRYALALETSNTSTSTLEGMTSLCQHVKALGRYGTTAFLVPLYGSGELPQAFCRSAAVHGGTYLLRRAPKRVLLQENGQIVKGIVLGGDHDHDESVAPGSSDDKSILCQHVVTSQEAMVNKKEGVASKQMLRRISILRGKLVDGGEQRHVILFPPLLVGNSHAIHGVAVDDSVQVAPAGCTVLHLTTTVDVDEAVDESILESAVESILSSQREGDEQCRELEEIYHVSFSHALCEPPVNSTSPTGLHVCPHLGQNLVIDAAFDQAKQIFDKICPKVDFLTLSEEMDTAVKERIGDREDENDDERMVLESAMNMIYIAPKEKTDNETETSR